MTVERAQSATVANTSKSIHIVKVTLSNQVHVWPLLKSHHTRHYHSCYDRLTFDHKHSTLC